MKVKGIYKQHINVYEITQNYKNVFIRLNNEVFVTYKLCYVITKEFEMLI